MKTNTFCRSSSFIVTYICLFLLGAAGLTAQAQTPASWLGTAGDADWNNPLNWDIGTPAQGTNAFIAAGSTVNYSNRMVAPSIAGMTNIGTFTISTNGFTIETVANTTAFMIGTNATVGSVTIISNGFVTLTNSGGLIVNTNSTLTISSGGTLLTTNSVGSTSLTIGFTAGRNNGATAVFTNATVTLDKALVVQGGAASGTTATTLNVYGGTLTASATRLLDTQDDSSTRIILNGNPVANLGDVVSQRNSTAGGIFITNGTVTTKSIVIGTGASRAQIMMVGGTLTNTGDFILDNGTATSTTADRKAYFYMRSGTLVNTGPNGIVIGNVSGGTSASSQIGAVFEVTGGTLTTEGFVLITNTSLVNLTTRLNMGAATVYVGANGIVANLGGAGATATVTSTNSVLAAKADWTSSVNMTLGGTTTTVRAADADGVAHNITLNGILSSGATLVKDGGGTVTLGGANTYSGNTIISTGTLALGASGALASPQIAVATGATFDVSAVSGGYTLAATRTLAGDGSVAGAVSVASGGIIDPGSNGVSGTVHFLGSLTETGGAINHYELSTAGPGPNNDFISVAGNLNLSGTNTIEIVGGGVPGSIHPLITYGGTFNGTVANLAVSGGSGTLLHNAGTKTISYQIASVVRSATNVVWHAASPANADWDVVNRSNFLNGTLQDYFVNNDRATFNDVGIASSNINITVNVSPTTLTVDSAGKYTFSGSGSIAGAATVLKTNVGTLVMGTTNTFNGGVTVAGGVLEASLLAAGGSASSIGASGASGANLVLNTGTLRYTGGTVSIDRGATLVGGGVVDVSNGATTLTLGGILAGDQLIKSGSGVLVLGTANTHTNGDVINGGTLVFGSATAPGTTAGGITNNSATLRVTGTTVIDHVVEFNGNCGLEFSGVGSGNVVLRGSWFGSGYVLVNFLSQNAAQVFTIGGGGSGGGNMAGFSGTVDFGTNSGSLRLNNDNSTFNTGSANATFNLGTGSGTLLHRNGGTYNFLGALFGGPNTKLSGRGNGTTGQVTWEIGGKNLDCNFDGQINDGGGGTVINKVGTGKLTLNGASIHTGATTVNNGTLEVNGSLSSSPVTVNAGFLTGNGSLGNVTQINSGATVTPGGAAIGKLSVNNLSFSFGSTNLLQLDKAHGTNDSIAGLTSLTCAGSLVITNLGGTLADHDVFPLFKFSGSPNISGVFYEIILPTPPSGVEWNTNEIYTTGRLILGTELPPAPQFNSFTLNGNNLVLSGSNGVPSNLYYVLTSTNVTTPVASWTPFATNAFNPDGSFSFTNVVNTNQLQRYFRIQDAGTASFGN